MSILHTGVTPPVDTDVQWEHSPPSGRKIRGCNVNCARKLEVMRPSQYVKTPDETGKEINGNGLRRSTQD